MLTIEPFQPRHLPAAAQLFVANYRALCHSNNLLPTIFQDAAPLQAMLANIITDQPGAVASQNGQVVGYLTGYANIEALKGKAAGVYVPIWAHAAERQQDKAATYAALYSHMAGEWQATKSYTHLIDYWVPDESLERLLFQLGFGLLVINGIRAITPLALPPLSGLHIRPASEADLPQLLAMTRRFSQYLRASPIFLNVPPPEPALDVLKADFLGQDKQTIVATKDKTIIACIRGELNMSPGTDLLDVAGSLGIDYAYTEPTYRQQGIHSHLLNALLRWGHSQGQTRCLVDFESANLAASGFWLKHFSAICHAAIRRADEGLG